jgi:hypothetical protein
MSETLQAARPSPSLRAGIGWVAAAARHAGWWLEWQTRNHAGQGCRALQKDREPLAARRTAA